MYVGTSKKLVVPPQNEPISGISDTYPIKNDYELSQILHTNISKNRAQQEKNVSNLKFEGLKITYFEMLFFYQAPVFKILVFL